MPWRGCRHRPAMAGRPLTGNGRSRRRVEGLAGRYGKPPSAHCPSSRRKQLMPGQSTGTGGLPRTLASLGSLGCCSSLGHSLGPWSRGRPSAHCRCPASCGRYRHSLHGPGTAGAGQCRCWLAAEFRYWIWGNFSWLRGSTRGYGTAVPLATSMSRTILYTSSGVT